MLPVVTSLSSCRPRRFNRGCSEWSLSCCQLPSRGKSRRCALILNSCTGSLSVACFTGYTQNHMWPLMYFCIFVTRLDFLSSNNKGIAWWRAPLHRGRNTPDTWEGSSGAGKVQETPRPFHRPREPRVRSAPAVILNLCPLEEIDKWPGPVVSNARFASAVPFCRSLSKTTTCCSDKEAF